MSTIGGGMPLGPQRQPPRTINPTKPHNHQQVQVGDGRNDMEDEERQQRGKARLEQTYEKQADEIGAPSNPQVGYTAPVQVTMASKEKIEKRRKDMPFMPVIHKEGSMAGLSVPGLAWASEDAVDRGDHNIEGAHTERDMTPEQWEAEKRKEDRILGMANRRMR